MYLVYDQIKPSFYKRFVDDVITRRNKGQPDELFQQLNTYHKNIKFTVEENPSKFLDTELYIENGIYKTKVYRKTTKLPPHWSSKTPKRFKRNAINGNLYRARKITSNMSKEVEEIKQKYLNADYPLKFINSVISQFKTKQIEKEEEDELIIPQNLFKEEKPLLLVKIPFCIKNETTSKHFIKKLSHFTNNKYDIRIQWQTKKIKQLFILKDKNPHPANVIYKGVCTCGETYVGETERNAKTRWNEHDDIRKDSEPAKHLLHNIGHSFHWSIIFKAPSNYKERKNLEASFIAVMRPTLNEQVKSRTLILFRNGIT